MQQPSPRTRTTALALKTSCLVVGAVVTSLALAFSFDEFERLAQGTGLGVGDVIVVMALVSLAFSGSALMTQLPESLRARFRRIPEVARRRPIYGFGTMVAVGLGATIGSPLFILIPLNVEQYEVVSLLSLLMATVFSVVMAKVYSDLGKKLKERNAELVGSPSFVRVANGARSVRYFISRVSMWVANTALAAYTKIVFLIFDFIFMPKVLAGYGLSSQASTLVVWLIAVAFVGWTLVNIFFEQRYLRALGDIQIVLTVALLLMLVYHSAVLGSSGGWNFTGFFASAGGTSWIPALIINTGYLYLLFFGFQEIQVFERDSVERSAVPLVSWLKKGYTVGRTLYFEAAMVVSVVVASAINILYGLAVYSGARGLPSLQASCSTSSCIPALYLAENITGGGQELLIGAAFLIATVTTFVPAFLAAARHLKALGEDGYMPGSLSRLSWVFTLVAVLFLAISNQNFLVEVTDVMVLISLGIIALSGLSLNKAVKEVWNRSAALVVGLGCFVFGGAIYFNPGGASVVVFGSMAVIFAYLVFDVIELGALGAQLFLSVFGFICMVALAGFQHVVYTGGDILSLTQLVGVSSNNLLFWSLLVSSVLLVANVVLDIRILRRTFVSQP